MRVFHKVGFTVGYQGDAEVLDFGFFQASVGVGYQVVDDETGAEVGLFPVEHEIWHGFVFIRLADDGGPSVAAMMAPHDAEIAPYRFADLRRFGKPTLLFIVEKNDGLVLVALVAKLALGIKGIDIAPENRKQV